MSDDLSEPNSKASSEITFQDLNLSGPLLEAIESSGYATPTPIQARTIPLLLEGRDVLGQAQTGTGKTAAFAIPLLQRIDLEQNVPQVLVLTPTRELAIQVAEAFERYASGLRGLRVTSIYGGQDYHIQFRDLDRGMHVVVGTPGRVMDHIRRGSLKLDSLRALVLDEADEMLKMGFAEDVEWVLTQSPAERQTALFSATMPAPIRRIAQQHLRNPEEVTITQGNSAAVTVRQRFVVVAPHQKEMVLARVLEAEPIEGVLIFVKTKSTTEPLAEYLASQGHRTAALSSDVPQRQRERIVENLRAGKIDVIVATDVAARGLDVQRISHVINYDLPFNNASYVHRIGRTGRAGRSGNAILFLHPRERYWLRRIEQATRQPIEPMDIPSKRVINQRRVARFHEQITAGLSHPAMASFASVVEQYQSEHDVPMEQIAAALACLAAGDTPLLLTDELKQDSFVEARDGRGDSRSRRPQRSFDEDRRGEPNGRPRHANDEGAPAERTRAPRPQSERGFAPRAPSEGGPPQGMETFRIEVGHAQQVKPANIVGAITNEIGVESSLIGRIEIFQEYSTVDLLAGMPAEIFNVLKRVRVGGRQLKISRLNGRPDPAPPRARPADAPNDGPRPAGKKFKAKAAKKPKKGKRATAKS